MTPFKTTVFLMVIIILVNGCGGRVPREVLDLSNTVGDDLKALHLSYRQLIIVHFDSLRQQIDSFIETRWIPVFIKDFIQRGNLAQMVQAPEPAQREAEVTGWFLAAMDAVNQKRNQLIKPLDEEEKKLLEMVDSSFNLLDQANAKIHSHLESLAKLNEPGEGALNIHDLKGLREKINLGLSAAAEKTQGITGEPGKAGNPAETGSTEKQQQQ